MEPYWVRISLLNKWKKVRNVIVIIIRLLKILKDVQTYGTSVKLLDIRKRRIDKIKEFMLPECKNSTFHFENKSLKLKGDKCMFKPNSKFMMLWNYVIIIGLIYSATVMPYKIALVDEDNISMFIIDTVIDFIFLIDILIQFNKPIIDENGRYNYNRRRVFLHYVGSWFLIDLISSLPTNLISKYIVFNNSGADKI